MLLERPPNAYSAATLSFSVQRMMPIGGVVVQIHIKLSGSFRRQLVRHRIPPYFIGIPCCQFALIYQYILFLAESKTPKTRGNVLLALRRHNRAKLSFRTNLIYKISTKVKSKIAGTSLPAILHFLFSRTPHPGSQTAGPAPCPPTRRRPAAGPAG